MSYPATLSEVKSSLSTVSQPHSGRTTHGVRRIDAEGVAPNTMVPADGNGRLDTDTCRGS